MLGALPDLPSDPALLAAAIAQQQSIYSADAYRRVVPEERAIVTAEGASRVGPASPQPQSQKSRAADKLDDVGGADSADHRERTGRHTTVVRGGGGKVWEDKTLLDWDPTHFRLYCGNLGGEVTDASLAAAFSAYGSLSRARVVRDKQSGKSRGFGFVAFAQADDVLAAWRAMNGKYVGSRPIQLRRAETDVRAVELTDRGLKRKQAKSTYERALHGEKTSLAVQQEQRKQHDRREQLQAQEARDALSAASTSATLEDRPTPAVDQPAKATTFIPRVVKKR